MKWLILAGMLMAFPAYAQPFETMWQDRVVLAITPVAQPFDEEQFSQDVAKRKADDQPKKKQHEKRDDSCLTLREARRKYPGRNLSWHDDHCWYAHKRHHHGD